MIGVFVLALASTMCIVARPSAAGEESPNLVAPETPAENALDQMMEIPNRFERNAALDRVVADADRQRIEALLAAVAAMPRGSQRDDVARVLYVRFVSLQPGPAVAHALRNLRQAPGLGGGIPRPGHMWTSRRPSNGRPISRWS